MASIEMTINNQIDCSSDIGITVGLVDAFLTIGHLLVDRDLETPEVKEALKDLKDDPDFNDLLLVMKHLS